MNIDDEVVVGCGSTLTIICKPNARAASRLKLTLAGVEITPGRAPICRGWHIRRPHTGAHPAVLFLIRLCRS